MKVRELIHQLVRLIKAAILWIWNIIVRVWKYNAERGFKLVFAIWGMILLSIFTIAVSISGLMVAGTIYSNTPQVQIVIDHLKPTIARMADLIGKNINTSLDRYEKKQQLWEAKEKAEDERKAAREANEQKVR